MNKIFFSFLLFLVHCKVFTQAGFDTTRCINEYRYKDEIKLAAKDTCLVSLTLGNKNIKSNKCVIPSELSSVENLFALVINSKKTIVFKNAGYKFCCLYSVFIKGNIYEKTFPDSFFSSPVLNDISLAFVNEIKRIPSAVLEKKKSENICSLIIFGNVKYSNNNHAFFSDLEALAKAKNFDGIVLYNCSFSDTEKDILKQLAAPTTFKFQNIKMIGLRK